MQWNPRTPVRALVAGRTRLDSIDNRFVVRYYVSSVRHYIIISREGRI
jgi:hypothetical protein